MWNFPPKQTNLTPPPPLQDHVSRNTGGGRNTFALYTTAILPIQVFYTGCTILVVHLPPPLPPGGMAVPSRHTHPILGCCMESYCAQLPGTQGTSILVACTAHCLTVCRWEYVILSCNKIAFSSVVQSDTVTPACTTGYCMANWLQKYKRKGMHVKGSC